MFAYYSSFRLVIWEEGRALRARTGAKLLKEHEGLQRRGADLLIADSLYCDLVEEYTPPAAGTPLHGLFAAQWTGGCVPDNGGVDLQMTYNVRHRR